MTSTLLLYGATGFTGRLIAAEARRAGMSDLDGGGPHRMVLAARDGDAVGRLAAQHGMEHRVFGLDDRDEIVRHLDGVDVVLNAAGPFARTAVPLARAALRAGCHYVDVNGEADVYRQLDDFGRFAERLNRVLVCGAGHSAAASDVLLDCALRHLREQGRLPRDGELGAVRIAMSRVRPTSRGSARTAWRALREQVTVVRARYVPAGGRLLPEPVFRHEPAGMRERAFDFGGARDGEAPAGPRLALAAAANLVDTLTAPRTLRRQGAWAHELESYVELGELARVAYPLAAMAAPLAALPGVEPIVSAQLALLPEQPGPEDLAERHAVVLQIEDRFRVPLVDWRWSTPNPYQFTAQLAVEVAARTAGYRDPGGWRTPAEILGDCRDWLRASKGGTPDPARGSFLEKGSL